MPVQAVSGLQEAIGDILDPDEWQDSREHSHRTLGLAAIAQALQSYSKPLRCLPYGHSGEGGCNCV